MKRKIILIIAFAGIIGSSISGHAEAKSKPVVKEEIKITELELMKLKNLGLEISLIKMKRDRELDPVLAKREELYKKIEDRLKIKLKNYRVNAITGVLKKIKGGEKVGEEDERVKKIKKLIKDKKEKGKR